MPHNLIRYMLVRNYDDGDMYLTILHLSTFRPNNMFGFLPRKIPQTNAFAPVVT